MLRTAFKNLALLAVVGVVLGAQQAQAGWSHRGCGSSGGSWGSSGGNRVIAPSSRKIVPATPSDVLPAPANSTYHPTYGPLRNDALLSVRVPADAKVFVNDRPTPSKGTYREYISRNLQSGNHYNYTVRVEYVRDGQTITENNTVQLVAGQSTNLDFSHGDAVVQAAANSQTSDALIGEAPADATLRLTGQETRVSSTLPEFSTSTLGDGSQSADRPILGDIQEHGQPEACEKKTAATEAPEVHRLAYPLSTAITVPTPVPVTLTLLGSAFWALGGLRLLRKATTCRFNRTLAILRGNSAQ